MPSSAYSPRREVGIVAVRTLIGLFIVAAIMLFVYKFSLPISWWIAAVMAVATMVVAVLWTRFKARGKKPSKPATEISPE
jgi:O-antigen/teichoic acid export membrane protein